MTAVYFRRFFPGDVVATVAYVAPLSLDAPDPRYVAAVETGAHADCRAKLRDFQRLAVARRPALEARMTDLSGATFTHLGMDEAFEHAVLENPFAFWQYNDSSLCPSIPAATATDDQVYAFLDSVSDIASYGDAQVERYAAYYVQAANELGYPEIDETNLQGMLAHAGTDRPESYVPTEVATRYLPAAMRDVDAWVRTYGERLLFVYGANDPWSGGMFELGDAQDSFRFIVAEGNHGSLIRRLAAADSDTALAALQRWTGVAAKLPAGKPEDEPPLERRPR
jgi:hypothetical protein